jgi:hypothetical protein
VVSSPFLLLHMLLGFPVSHLEPLYVTIVRLHDDYSDGLDTVFIIHVDHVTGHSIFAHSRSSTSEGFCLFVIDYSLFEYLQNKPAHLLCPVNVLKNS